MLKRINISDCKPCSTPLEPKCNAGDFANSELFEGPFCEFIGSLLYLVATTRPDILFIVNCLSQLQEKPTVAAWTGLKRILRYLKDAKNFKLVYKKLYNPNFTIDLYSDIDWASDSIDRKSVSGNVLMFCNCPILWCCEKQNCTSLSSTEAEIIALIIVNKLRDSVIECFGTSLSLNSSQIHDMTLSVTSLHPYSPNRKPCLKISQMLS
ncbi:Copia protein [Araneus ventricosus]|uniref:Copia protein n=1 Tax=Araneus ventricosus TaxID=182803 RepID=A0A4Y2RWH7_ARAVE|nr:Copia protein [Araneus ventricosus]